MLIRVKVDAGAKHDSIRKVSESSYHVSVRVPAKENQANEHVKALVAAYFGVPKQRVQIRTGHHRPNKSLQIG